VCTDKVIEEVVLAVDAPYGASTTRSKAERLSGPRKSQPANRRRRRLKSKPRN
jgi:hypothetical protein